MGDDPKTPSPTVDTTAVATNPPATPPTGLWRRGADGGYVDIDRREARRMLAMPPEPENLPPDVASDFVAMLGAIQTVVNDGEVRAKPEKGGGVLFKYPTAGAIFTAARETMLRHNFAALFPGGYTWHPRDNCVVLKLSFLHTATGQIIPMGESIMPCDGNNNKAVCCAVTELRKYMLGLALNMSWNDSTEDAIQRRERGTDSRTQSAPQTTQRKTYPAGNGASATAAPISPPPHSEWMKPQYTDLLDTTREALKTMRDWGFTPNQAVTLATGRAGSLSKTPLPSICDSIVTTVSILEKRDRSQIERIGHSGLLALAAETQNPLAYENGKITEWGAALDLKFLSPKPAAAEPEDPRQPPAAWQNEGGPEKPGPSKNGSAPVQGAIDPDDIPF